MSEDEARTWIGAAFSPTADQWARLDRFAQMLIAENDRQNLIAASTIPTIWVRHIADSAQLLALDTEGEGLWVDLGSGPGLPGQAPLERVETRRAATISARAFAPLDKLIDLSARFSTESTHWLLPKGRNAVKELALLPEPWQRMFHVEQSRTDAESQILVGSGKIAAKQRGKR